MSWTADVTLEQLAVIRAEPCPACRWLCQYNRESGHRCSMHNGAFRASGNDSVTEQPRVALRSQARYSRISVRQWTYRPIRITEGTRMAPRTKPQLVNEAEVDEAEDSEKDYTVYADKDTTFTMENFATWLIDEVYEGKLPKDMDEDVFRKGVALGGSLRMEFQRSEWWKEVRAEHQAEREAEKATKAKAKAAEAAEEEPAPRKPARGKASTVTSTSTTTKAAPARSARRGRAASAPAEAPF